MPNGWSSRVTQDAFSHEELSQAQRGTVGDVQLLQETALFTTAWRSPGSNAIISNTLFLSIIASRAAQVFPMLVLGIDSVSLMLIARTYQAPCPASPLQLIPGANRGDVRTAHEVAASPLYFEHDHLSRTLGSCVPIVSRHREVMSASVAHGLPGSMSHGSVHINHSDCMEQRHCLLQDQCLATDHDRLVIE